MTRKDYVALAEAFAKTRPYDGLDQTQADGIAFLAWYEAFCAVADVLEADNPRFDRLRFAHAAAAERLCVVCDDGRTVAGSDGLRCSDHATAEADDMESSASRQHYIDTGRYLLAGEAIES